MDRPNAHMLPGVIGHGCVCRLPVTVNADFFAVLTVIMMFILNKIEFKSYIVRIGPNSAATWSWKWNQNDLTRVLGHPQLHQA